MSKIFHRIFSPPAKANRSGAIQLTGKVITSTSGTISSQDCPGFTVTKTATKTGRYTVQLVDGHGSAACVALFTNISVAVISTTADSAYTKDKGLVWFIRDLSPTTGSFKLQFTRNVEDTGSTFPDAELEDAASFLISIGVKCSSVSP